MQRGKGVILIQFGRQDEEFAVCRHAGLVVLIGRLKKIRYLYIPHLTGYVISSVGVAVAMGVKVVIMAELLGASEGVGARIADARAMLETSTVMAYVVLVIVFVSLFEYLITKPLEILFMPWRR